MSKKSAQQALILTSSHSFHESLKKLCYPLLFLTALTLVVTALLWNLSFSLCSISFLFWVITYLTVMERLIPYEPRWLPTKKEWLSYSIYFFLTMLGGGLAVATVFSIAAYVNPHHSELPLFIELLLALLLTSLCSYLFHRFSHVQPWLWRLHGIHHIENKVNVGNNGVNHILDVYFRRLLAQAPLILLGFSEESIFIVGIFNAMQGYFVHANIDVKLGFMNYIIVSPEQHRLHHSKDLSEAGHYSVDIAFWDLIFASYFWRKGRVPQNIGVLEPAKFPAVNQIFSCLIFPWKRKKN